MSSIQESFNRLDPSIRERLLNIFERIEALPRLRREYELGRIEGLLTGMQLARAINKAPDEPLTDADRLLIKTLAEQATTGLDEDDAAVRSEGYGEDRQIGVIDGIDVEACYGEGRLFQATIEWGDLTVSTDGRSYISFGEHDDNLCPGDIPLATWGQIRELAQTDVIDTLITLARQNAELAA